ncbi:MAG: hypothetical protein IPK13_09665 [Deltaproteobacteria bacterium]|nr:hypothetical protein [Deltaproteobacteria bacterium]
MSAERQSLVRSQEPPHANIQVSLTLPPRALLARCDELRIADKRAERRKALFGKLALGSFLGVFILFLAGAVLEQFYLLPLAGLLFLGFVGSLIARGVAGAADIDDLKLDVAETLCRVMASDLKKRAPVGLSLDFRGYDKGKPAADSTRFWSSTGVKTFVRPWLRMNMTLLDGTRVLVEAETHCKRKQRAKRKYTKMKDRVTDHLTLTFRPPADRTLDREHASLIQQRLSLTGRGGPRDASTRLPSAIGLELVRCRIKPREAVMCFRTAPSLRVRARGGWTGSNLERLLDGRKAFGALILSYRSMKADASSHA